MSKGAADRHDFTSWHVEHKAVAEICRTQHPQGGTSGRAAAAAAAAAALSGVCASQADPQRLTRSLLRSGASRSGALACRAALAGEALLLASMCRTECSCGKCPDCSQVADGAHSWL